MNRITWSCLLLAGLSLSSCINPNTATKENFTKVLNNHLATDAKICKIYSPSVPDERRLFDDIDKYGARYLEALSTVGFLQKQETVKTETFLGTPRQVTYAKYDLSEKGKQLVKKDPKGLDYFSYCQAAVKEIQAFTAPSDTWGATVSQVKYTYVIEKIDDWAKNEAIINDFYNVKANLENVGKPIEAQQSLVLTNEGWSAKF